MIGKKIPHHEFWPQWVMYSPVYLDYVLASLKIGSMKYPFVVNPMMELSGFLGEDKYRITKTLPEAWVPTTVYIDLQSKVETQFHWQPGKTWVAKPNQGERGLGVRKISSSAELAMYHSQAPRPYILQEYVDLPVEFGLFFVRLPKEPKGRITSLCLKDPISVVGDGENTVRKLCEKRSRFIGHIERLGNIVSDKEWDRVPAPGEVYHLDVIRNHRRGSKFRDARHLISDEMQVAFQKILPPEIGFNYGRVDLRAESVEEFQKGRGFRILEINGVTSEPGEIYDPTMDFQTSLSILRQHWDYVAAIGGARLKDVDQVPKVGEIYQMLKEAITRPAFFDR